LRDSKARYSLNSNSRNSASFRTKRKSSNYVCGNFGLIRHLSFALASKMGKRRLESGFVSSLRRHYPDQVQRVDGKRSHPLSRVYPSSPLRERMKNRVYKRWLLGFFKEIAWPVRPGSLLRFRTEINLQLNANSQGYKMRGSDN